MSTLFVAGANSRTAVAADGDWHRLWFSLLKLSRNSFAIVPTHSAVDTDQLGQALVEAGRQHGGKAVRHVNAVGARLGDVQRLIELVREIAASDVYVIVSVDPIADNPAALPIASAASGVLLAVRIGESLLASARSTIEGVGRERLVGSIVLG